MFFTQTERGFIFKRGKETVRAEAWRGGIRVRATEYGAGVDGSPFSNKDWALLPDDASVQPELELDGENAELRVGRLRMHMDQWGKAAFYNDRGNLLLKEYYRTWERGVDFSSQESLDQIVMVRSHGREYKAENGAYHVRLRFEADDNEMVFGMGQYQQPHLNRKGALLELKPYNTQAPVPFIISNKGYGFLFNNPGIGRVSFATGLTEWELEQTRQIDYWICAGDTPEEIHDLYMAATGTPPEMPEYGYGFWQCKLRYQTQNELVEVAREYKRRGIPLKVIVVDYFHWTRQGEWRFDNRYWPDPEGMIRELNELGIRLMVSVWPTVDKKASGFEYMKDHDLLVRVEKGTAFTMDCFGSENFIDPTNPEAQAYWWDICKKNYFDKGVSLFWLDEAEPEYTAADFDIYRYYVGPVRETAAWYSVQYARAFYDGMLQAGVKNPVSLIRCAWAGSQRYGALAWSGDVPSTFTSLRNQISAGLSMGIAGIPWWTADIGGFHGGNPNDPDFRELMIRWFQFGTFCPVMRLHGDREPHSAPLGADGGGLCPSGAPNEIWSYGPEAEAILTRFIHLRESLKDYIKDAMRQAHTAGTPVMRPLFYHYPQDSLAWRVEDEYLFGRELLVAPVYRKGERARSVYFPAGDRWIDIFTGTEYGGGAERHVAIPLDRIGCFVRKGSENRVFPTPFSTVLLRLPFRESGTAAEECFTAQKGARAHDLLSDQQSLPSGDECAEPGQRDDGRTEKMLARPVPGAVRLLRPRQPCADGLLRRRHQGRLSGGGVSLCGLRRAGRPERRPGGGARAGGRFGDPGGRARAHPEPVF